MPDLSPRQRPRPALMLSVPPLFLACPHRPPAADAAAFPPPSCPLLTHHHYVRRRQARQKPAPRQQRHHQPRHALRPKRPRAANLRLGMSHPPHRLLRLLHGSLPLPAAPRDLDSRQPRRPRARDQSRARGPEGRRGVCGRCRDIVPTALQNGPGRGCRGRQDQGTRMSPRSPRYQIDALSYHATASCREARRRQGACRCRRSTQRLVAQQPGSTCCSAEASASCPQAAALLLPPFPPSSQSLGLYPRPSGTPPGSYSSGPCCGGWSRSAGHAPAA